MTAIRRCRNKVKVMLHTGTKDIHRRQEVDKEGLYLMILQIDVKTQSILCVRRLLNNMKI